MTAAEPVDYSLSYDPAWLRLAEPAARDPLSEAELSRIWEGQAFPPEALTTADGRPVRVVLPGRLNTGPGPDFRDAIIGLDGEERGGDIELHVRASSFQAHGHNSDPAYDRLVLHVVYLADGGTDTRLKSGGSVPVAAFAPWLARRTADIAGWLAAPALWQEPCRDAEARLGGDAIALALGAAGQERFAVRTARVAADIAGLGTEAALWRALFESLGVGGDRGGFRRLAVAFPPTLARLTAGLQRDVAREALASALLGVAGLGEPPQELRDGLPAPIRPALVRTGRPLNWPDRRLRAFAALWSRAGGDLAGYAAESVRQAGSAKALVAAWQAPADTGPALLGPERAQELLVNAVLPFVAASAELRPPAESLLAELRPAGAYGKTAFLEANLRRPDGKRRVSSALEQQGLLAMLSEWCRRGGCGRCPLS
ncbi:MAG: DUF2851 family protein [Dehalococcoidia bacterium]|nr:DUF2851 family protein [Dehalococcoidia bacterium]